MKVRVYDKTTGNYFKSEVYARINTGWYEKQLVHVPSENGGYSCFFDYLDKGEDNESPKVLINTITPDTPKEWIYQKSGSVDEKLPDFEKLLCNGVRFFEYIGFQLLTNCKQLKLKAADGKRYNTNVANTGELLRIIQSIPSPKAESFKMWLAQVERERIEETIDPELTIDRALATYLKKDILVSGLTSDYRRFKCVRSLPMSGMIVA